MIKSGKGSSYFFVGKLSDNSVNYQVQEAKLTNNFTLEVFLDGIAVWGYTKKGFDDLKDEIKEILNLLIAAVSFQTKKPLSYFLNNWVEAKEVKATKNIIGWMMPLFKQINPKTRKSPINTPWKKAVWFYNNLSKGNNNHSLALKDFHSAISDASDDAFLFAYRAVEDICRAINGCDEIEDKHWQKMHHDLGTTKKMLDPLTRVATKVRHGNKNHKSVIQARSNRYNLLQISHNVITQELKRTFKKFP
ncbi:hypothetical protein HYU92_03640 [Candidatus Curtissbacteria bacterium]|nr:hypothetical protein [Candidatus Curtissbacteria bacterium]